MFSIYIMANAWMDHVKNTMKLNKGLKFKEILKKAKKTYKKVAKAIVSKFTKKDRKSNKNPAKTIDAVEDIK